jgi:hypothetical protein
VRGEAIKELYCSINRVPESLPSAELGSSISSPARESSPWGPKWGEEGARLACGAGVGGTQFRRRDRDSGTLGILHTLYEGSIPPHAPPLSKAGVWTHKEDDVKGFSSTSDICSMRPLLRRYQRIRRRTRPHYQFLFCFCVS